MMIPRLMTPGRLRAVNLLCLAAIVFYAGWYTCSFQIRHHAFGPADLLDYALNYERSLLVADRLTYPVWSSGFLYPPPNLVLRLTLGNLGLEASAVLWMALLIVATMGSIEVSLYLLGLSDHPTKYLIGLLALGSVSYYFEWDLKYLNGNVLYLISILGALVLRGPHTGWTIPPRIVAAPTDGKRAAEARHRMVRLLSPDKRVSHVDSLAKYAAAFFKMSRSSVTRANSRFSRAISAAGSAGRPEPGNAPPCAATAFCHL